MGQIVKKAIPHEPPAKDEKVNLILEAARKRFAQYGFSKVTMEEVAEDLGVVKGAIYYYFPTKEKLYEAVLRAEHQVFIAEIQKIHGQALPSAEMLRRYVEKRQQFGRELVNLSQLDYQSWMRIRSNFQSLIESFEREDLAFLEQLFQEGRANGELSLSNPRRMATLFLHTLQGLRFRAFRDNRTMQSNGDAQAPYEEEIKLFTQVFLRAIKR